MYEQKDKEKDLPWYLRSNPSIAISFLAPPIGYLIILLNLKKMDKETKIDRFTFASIMAAIWSLKFLPRNAFGITIVVLTFLFFTFLLIWKAYSSLKK
ncbi:hypothetical protein JFL43_07555 [Viridibacillus sp. YIM B01967]|uniref:Uncharacterized protein n=1 Tax=Viridibacillus soli TaxID=2798301 RepID=A0ABS1H5Q6_9BACL|nr:hypothetical protein [Viridibacillus soli]MBK3494715.1 hypothetical protein [Viridibacillus soli]